MTPPKNQSHPLALVDYSTPEEFRAALIELRADKAVSTSVLAARAAFDLAIDVREDVPGFSGRLASGLLSLASRLLYRYAIRHPRDGGAL